MKRNILQMTEIEQDICTHCLVCVMTALVPKNMRISCLQQALNSIKQVILRKGEKKYRVLLHPECGNSPCGQGKSEWCAFFGGTWYGFCGHTSAIKNWTGFIETFYRVARYSSCFACKLMIPCPSMCCF